MGVEKKKRQRLDSIFLDETYYTKEGYLIDHPIVTTCGVFEYRNTDGSIRRELRLPEHVFNETSLKSYKGKPIIITHDAGEVDKDNVRREQIGTIMSEGYQDGENVRCEIIIHDTNALKRCGLKELSLGYSLEIEDGSGVWQGETYDCIQKNIEINHLALVAEARAGETARLNIDSKELNIEDKESEILKGGRISMRNENGYRVDEGEELSPEELEAAIALFKAQKAANAVNGEGMDGEEPTLGEEEPEKEKSPIERVRENMKQRDAKGNEISMQELVEGMKSDLDILLEEIDKLQASNDMETSLQENENLDGETPSSENETMAAENLGKEKEMNMDAVNQLINDKVDVCRMADKLHLDGVEHLSVTEARKKIIKAVNPKMNLDGKSESYINAAYDIAKQSFSERKTTDDQRQKMVSSQTRKDTREESNSNVARKKMIARMKGEEK